jgi:HAD superfamily hydrolase (TIGR01548 family)
MKNKKLIVFDMDGVLVDVSGSYRETVRQTARLFFKIAPSFEKLPDPLFPLSDLAAVKQSGGLNNDWDLSCLVINLLFNQTEKPPVYQSKEPRARYQETINRCDVGALGDFLRSTPQPLTALLQKVGKTKNAFIYGLYTGDVGSGNIIKQIFQEVYLGKELFEATYDQPPKFYRDTGLIHHEKVLVDKRLLGDLAAKHVLAIATGRPRAEANYPLARFGIRKYFTRVMALEDCIEKEKQVLKAEGKKVLLSKPHPYMLDALSAETRNAVAGYVYIGDMPDDMVAAKRAAAGYKGIGVLISAPDKARLKADLLKAGADFVIENFDQLRSSIESVKA